MTGVSRDRQRLLLVDAAGTEFSLDVDARLRAALRGEPGSGQMENTMESALRPRDIQARIRSGESAEDVAAAAGTPVEKIMIYAAPVLAEREHMAVRAQDSSVRRRSVGDSAARTLGQAVEQQMHEAEADHESIEWDAWQREDRRWVLIASYESGQRSGIAEFVFDPRGNYVTTSNEDAQWLVGDPLPEAAPVRDDLQQARARREQQDTTPAEPATAVDAAPSAPERTDEILTALEPAEAPAPVLPVTAEEDDTIDLGETAARIRGMVAAEADLDTSLGRTPPAAPLAPAPAEPAEQPAAPEGESEQLALDEIPAPPAPKKKKSRRSVPSWDEIMFGGGPTKDE